LAQRTRQKGSVILSFVILCGGCALAGTRELERRAPLPSAWDALELLRSFHCHESSFKCVPRCWIGEGGEAWGGGPRRAPLTFRDHTLPRERRGELEGELGRGGSDGEKQGRDVYQCVNRKQRDSSDTDNLEPPKQKQIRCVEALWTRSSFLKFPSSEVIVDRVLSYRVSHSRVSATIISISISRSVRFLPFSFSYPFLTLLFFLTRSRNFIFI